MNEPKFQIIGNRPISAHLAAIDYGDGTNIQFNGKGGDVYNLLCRVLESLIVNSKMPVPMVHMAVDMVLQRIFDDGETEDEEE